VGENDAIGAGVEVIVVSGTGIGFDGLGCEMEPRSEGLSVGLNAAAVGFKTKGGAWD
jgi:hypothetical protein